MKPKKIILPSNWFITFIVNLALVCFVFIFLFQHDKYTLIFSHADDVASWNAWAVELSENAYKPYNAAYPILIPGLWSLVYRAQENSEIWLFTKASLIFQPIVISIGVLYLFQIGKKVSSIFLAFVSFYFFVICRGWEMMLGYMDIPVASMILISSITLIGIVNDSENQDEEIYYDRLLFSAALCGLTSIVKQPGMIMIFLFLLILVYSLRKRKEFKLNKIITCIFLLLVPIITYFIIFSLSGFSPIGNIDVLRSLVIKVAETKGISLFENAVNMMSDEVSFFFFIGIISIGLLNLVRLKNSSGKLGFIFFIMAIIGFFLYAECCAYWPRNGYWIYSLLFCSATLALEPPIGNFLYPKLKENENLSISIKSFYLGNIFFVILLTSFGLFIKNDYLIKWNHNMLMSKLMPREVSDMLVTNLDGLKDDWIIFSPYQGIRWLPNFKDNYIQCVQTECAKKLLKENKNVYILSSDHTTVQTYKGLIDKIPKEYLIESIKHPKLYGNTNLYGPFNHFQLKE